MADESLPYSGPVVARDDSIAAKQRHYFTGVPCPKGHLAQRRVIGNACIVCASKRGKKWRESRPDYYSNYRTENRERLEAYRAERYAKNADQAKADARIWRLANPERKKATDAAWRAANAEAALAKSLNWQKDNPDRRAIIQVRWRKKNPEVSRAIVRNRRARKQASGGKHTAAQVKAMLVAQRYRCASCNRSIRKIYHADHIQPIARGGSNDISNLQLLCEPCNFSKGAKDPFVWARSLGRLL